MALTKARRVPYHDQIVAVPASAGFDPRHIEAFMRVGYPTLDAFSKAKFAHEVKVAVDCIKECGVEMAERIAKSYGF